MHGLELSRWMSQATDGDLLIEQGALYQALSRMEKRCYLQATWGHTEHGRRGKYLTLTSEGSAHLREELDHWTRYVEAVAKVDGPAKDWDKFYRIVGDEPWP